MKKVALILILAISISEFSANLSYESKIKDLAQELAVLVERRGIQKIAIWNFQALDSTQKILSKQLSEDLSVHLTNSSSTLQVFDRQFLDQILKELRLQQSPIVDQNTTKKLGAFTGVEAIVTGQFSLTGSKLRLWTKVLETETAFQIAALKSELRWTGKDQISSNVEKRKDQYKQKAKRIRSEKKIGKGSLYLKNGKAVAISVNLTNGEFKKTVLVGSNSSSIVYGLKPGVYRCVASMPVHDSLLESFEVKISKNRRSHKKFKGFNLFRFF